GLALWRDLADQQVAVADLGTDPDDPALVEVRQDLLGDVGDVPGDLLRAQLGVAGVDLVLLDVDRGEDVVLHQALAEDDGVLVVVTLPRHERPEEVPAGGPLPFLGARSVRDDLAGFDPVTLEDHRLLVHAGTSVGTAEPVQQGGAPATGVLLHTTGYT